MVVFVESFSRPRLACGFDFFGEVFTAGNVSERCRPTSVMSQPINVDHQNENENPIHFDAPFVPPNTKATCQGTIQTLTSAAASMMFSKSDGKFMYQCTA